MIFNSRTDGNATATVTAPLSRGPQPGWMTLDQARERVFTGEIVFETEPEIRTYLDAGVVYYAERASDAPLAQRLIEAGLIDHDQLDRGTVRVGDIEHLGRLFDRDDTVDRDAILVVTETLTDELVARLANEVITTIRSTAYRHHPSGLHRWFAARVEDANGPRLRGGVPSLESGVVDDIPGLPLSTSRAVDGDLYIEWDEPVIGGGRPTDDVSILDEFDDSLLQAMLDSLDDLDDDLDDDLTFHDVTEADVTRDADVTAEAGVKSDEVVEDEMNLQRTVVDQPKFETVKSDDEVTFDEVTFDDEVKSDEEFHVFWPDDEDESVPDAEDTFAKLESDARPEFASVVDNDHDHDNDHENEHDDDDEVEFEMVREFESVFRTENLTESVTETVSYVEVDVDGDVDDGTGGVAVESDEEIVAEAPDDVAEAVRRVVATFESQSTSTRSDAGSEAIAAPVAAFGGFAPPSLDMSAEAIYARAIAEMQAAASAASAAVHSVAMHSVAMHSGAPVADAEPSAWIDPVAPATRVGSVVFVERADPGEPGDGANERVSALRRLIGSLRRKDR